MIVCKKSNFARMKGDSCINRSKTRRPRSGKRLGRGRESEGAGGGGTKAGKNFVEIDGNPDTFGKKIRSGQNEKLML